MSISHRSGSLHTLVFVRHGLTDWNLDGRFQGQLDIPLNAIGRLQAWSLRKHLSDSSFDTIYTSPLLRAHETASIIAGSAPVLADWRLAEIHHGDWQGRTKQEVASQWPELWESWNKDPLRVTSSGGESPERVRERVEDLLQTISGQSVLCVSHGIVIQAVQLILLGASHAAPQNASIHSFYFQKDKMIQYRMEEIG